MWCAAPARRGPDLLPHHRRLPLFPGPVSGRKIGLFGGSFDPAHAGHRHLAELALNRLDLDYVWWMPALGNPLKVRETGFEARVASAKRAIDGHPRMKVAMLERQFDTRYTLATLRRLLPRARGARFVWLMGADNLAGFHHWGDWQEIARLVPIAVIARPGNSTRARLGRFARTFASSRLPEGKAASLAHLKPPAWVYLKTRLHPVSSTQLRWAARFRNPFRQDSAGV